MLHHETYELVPPLPTTEHTESTEGKRLLFEDECYHIRGALFEVRKELGPGFLEGVYPEALPYEFLDRRIPFLEQVELPVHYKHRKLLQVYKADFICFEKIIIELKAVNQLIPEHTAQLMNYLKATGLHLGLLVNFCSPEKLDIRRIVK